MTNDRKRYPQVALFGSTVGDWREKHIIPVLESLGVSYFHPGASQTTWTEEMGEQEAVVLAKAETIVMVVNTISPAFGSLAETGWMAVGCLQRGQTYILHVEMDYHVTPPAWYWLIPGMTGRLRAIEDYSNRARFLAKEHGSLLAKEIPNLYVVESMADIVALLRQKYAAKTD
jgi:hypothetical protein